MPSTHSEPIGQQIRDARSQDDIWIPIVGWMPFSHKAAMSDILEAVNELGDAGSASALNAACHILNNRAGRGFMLNDERFPEGCLHEFAGVGEACVGLLVVTDGASKPRKWTAFFYLKEDGSQPPSDSEMKDLSFTIAQNLVAV